MIQTASWKTRKLLICALGLLAAIPLAAQEGSPAPSDPITLAEALEVARENNPAYRISVAELDNAAVAERGLWRAFMPSVSLSFNTGLSQSRNYTGLDEFGQPVRRDDPLVYTSSRSSQSIGLGQITLFDGGSRLANARAERANAGVIRAGAAAAAIELRSEISRRYQEVVVAEREVALNEGMVASASEILEGTERLLRIGRKDPIDLLGAELQLAESEHALERARGAVRTARLALGEEMGVGREVTGDLIDDLPEVFDPAVEVEVERLVEAAVESSPTVARLTAGVDAAQHQLGAARGRRWPTVTLGLNAPSRAISGSGSGALFDMSPQDQNYGFSLAFGLPLFDGFETSDNITRARVGTVTAAESLRAGQLQLETRIRGAVIDLENAYREILLAERGADLSQRRLELAQQTYQLGGASFEELRSASDDAFTREHAVITARHAFASALLALEEAAGVLVR